MKGKKLILIIGIISFAVLFSLLFLNKVGDKTGISKLRESHAEFLRNHPYQKTSDLSKKERRELGIPPNAYFDQKYLSEINPTTGRVHRENIFKLQERLKNNRVAFRAPGDATDNPWIERGPNNVGGRTRAIIFDPNDATDETVFAGGVSGGLWRNRNISNASSEWEQVGIPENLAVSSIAVDPNNTAIFYVGTGESFTGGDANGNGLWKSVDGGNTWSKIFGGITGPSFFQENSTVKVNMPSPIQGDYPSILTNSFGGDLSSDITGDLVLVNDGTDVETDACEALVNAADLVGKIAVIERGSCNFTDKVIKAQDAGAIAVIMLNNVTGDPISMGGENTSITIPAVMISQANGNIITNALTREVVNVTLTSTGSQLTGLILPGVQNINDILVRNNAGVSEVYVTVGETSNQGVSLGGDTIGVYKSVDGENFSRLNIPNTTAGNPYEPNNIELGADNSIFLSTNRSAAYGDGGGAIFNSTNGIDFNLLITVPNGLRTEITVSSTNANKGYILAQINDNSTPVKIFKTVDKFQNITEITLPNDADTDIPANDFTRDQAGYNLLIKVNPDNDETIFVGGIDLFGSTNGGNSWTQLSHWFGGFGFQEVHADQHGIAFSNNSSSKMIFSNDGGVSFSSDGGNIIRARNRNYNTLQFYTVGVAPTSAFTGDYFLAGAQDNGTQLFENASPGINSSREASGGDGAHSFFDTDGTERYYISNFVYNRSINLFNYRIGTRVNINRETESNGDFINQEELDSNLNILYSNYSSGTNFIVRMYDNILSGTPIKADLTNGLMDGEPSALKISPFTTASSNLFVGLKNGKLLQVKNANSSSIVWSEITGSDFVGSISDIEFGANENEIFVTMHNYGVVSIWYTNDGGVTWGNKEGDFPDIPVKTILQNPLNRKEVIIGTDLGIWKTDDFSVTAPKWTQSFNGMSNVPVTDMDLRDDNTVFVSTYGRGVFSGKFTGTTASVEEVNKGNELFAVYPTVSNGELTVFAKRETGKTKVNIFNLSGSQVYSNDIDFSQEEKQKISVNLSGGIYLVQLIDANNRKLSRKIIIK